MYSTLYYKILELESMYDSGYITKCLTRLSNSDILIDKIDKESIMFNYIDLRDSNRIKIEMDNILNSNNCTIDCISESIPPSIKLENVIRLRDIFGIGTNLTNVVKFINYFISNKEFLKDLGINNITQATVEVLSRLIYNLNLLVLFMDKEIIESVGSSIDMNPREVIISNDSRESIDLDDEIIMLNRYHDKYCNTTEDDKLADKQQVDDAKSFREWLKNIGRQALRIKIVINKCKMNVNNFVDRLNIARDIFYKRNIGKIDHLYKFYGYVTIKENELNDDPVRILFGKCGQYLSNLIDEIIGIYHGYNSHIDKLFNCKLFRQAVDEVNRYITYNDVKLDPKTATPKDMKKSLAKDLRYKIGCAILRDHEVYGYTVKGIVENKYPPIHHVIISLFLPKPHESAVEQAVNQIFAGPESFVLMSRKMKDIVKESATLIDKKISSISITNDFKNISNSLIMFNKNSKHDIQISKVEGDIDPNKEMKKILNVLRDHQGILESFIPIFIYLADAGNVMYDVSTRIDYTCQDAVKAMLNEESHKTDKGYNDGTKHITKDYKTSGSNNE